MKITPLRSSRSPGFSRIRRAVNADEPLSLGRALLERGGWTVVEASTRLEPGPFAELLGELARDRCVHSWKNLARPELSALVQSEASLRPTTVFGYWGRRRGAEPELLAAAAISDRVRASFPHDGFPVLARCYIRPRFRRLGLYAHLLNHRLEVCKSVWGGSLRAVHLGSSDPRVWRCVDRLPSQPGRFVPVGFERLKSGARLRRVRDFLYFTDGYAAALRGAASTPALRSNVELLLSGWSGERGYERLRAAAEAAPDARPGSALRRLLAFFEAVPLAR